MQIFAGKIFKNPTEIIQAFDNKSFIEAFSRIEKLKSCQKHYLLGYIRYEAKNIFLGEKIKTKEPLLYFEVFNFPCHCEEEQSSDAAIQKNMFGLLQPKLRNDKLYTNIKPKINYNQYSNAIAQIKEEIACGNTYEVNYTYDYKIKTKADGFELYNSILPNQKTPYNAYIKNEYEEILSFSPELFFTIVGNKIVTKPMKGTIKRGETEQEDKNNIKFLKNDIKNRAENVMIVDLLRNDLGKIAKTGSVKVDKLFEIETHKTLHQMTSEISAELEDNTTLFEIFDTIFPCGSITGAPKISTMEIIDKVEVGKRGVYCGAIGLISPEETVFSVPIRILRKKNNEKHFLCRVGGAIVWDSTASEEWEETLTKISFLKNPSVSGIVIPPYSLVETILVQDGKMKYKTEHFNRMKKSAKDLGFKFNKEIEKLTPEKDGILRILLNNDGSFETQYLPLNQIKTSKICISKTLINSKEVLLYHKTTFRPWYENSKEKIKNGEIFDEIFFNEACELTEGSRSNIVLELNGKLYTPPLKCGLLNGVLRQKLLTNGGFPPPAPSPSSGEGKIALNTKLQICEKILYLNDIKNAEKIFCINSVRGIMEVEL